VFSRWASRARRLTRTSWTSRASSAPSSSPPGRSHRQSHRDEPWAPLNATWSVRYERDFWCVLQLRHRERRVAGGHRQGDRRLHQEEDNLHIQPKSGGGTAKQSVCLCSPLPPEWVHLNPPPPPVSLAPGGGRRGHRGPVGFKGPHLDPRPEGHHVHDVHLWVHAHLEEASLSRLWTGLYHKHHHHHRHDYYTHESP